MNFGTMGILRSVAKKPLCLGQRVLRSLSSLLFQRSLLRSRIFQLPFEVDPSLLLLAPCVLRHVVLLRQSLEVFCTLGRQGKRACIPLDVLLEPGPFGFVV